MKSIIAAIAITMTAIAPTQASEYCTEISKLAENIMTGRQAGVPMPQMIEIAGDNGAAKAMVMEAYGRNRYQTESIQQRAIGEFRDAWYLACLQAEGE